MFEIEVGENVRISKCDCCGAESRNGHGFVHSDGSARAVYYVGWTDKHRERGVAMAIAIGEWDDASTAQDRTGFGLVAHEEGERILFGFVGPDDSPWPRTELFGSMVDREAALAHPLSEEALLIAEAVVRSHPAVREFLRLSS